MKYKFLSTKIAPHRNIVDMTTRQGSGGWWLHTDYPFTYKKSKTWRLFLQQNANSIVYAIIPNKL